MIRGPSTPHYQRVMMVVFLKLEKVENVVIKPYKMRFRGAVCMVSSQNFQLFLISKKGTYSPGLASPILITEKIVSHAIRYYHINEKLMFFICFMYLGAVSFYHR